MKIKRLKSSTLSSSLNKDDTNGNGHPKSSTTTTTTAATVRVDLSSSAAMWWYLYARNFSNVTKTMTISIDIIIIIVCVCRWHLDSVKKNLDFFHSKFNPLFFLVNPVESHTSLTTIITHTNYIWIFHHHHRWSLRLHLFNTTLRHTPRNMYFVVINQQWWWTKTETRKNQNRKNCQKNLTH